MGAATSSFVCKLLSIIFIVDYIVNLKSMKQLIASIKMYVIVYKLYEQGLKVKRNLFQQLQTKKLV